MNYFVYSDLGELVGLFKYAEDAAAVIGAGYSGGIIRDGNGKELFRDGKDGDAADSYDYVAEVCAARTVPA